jgi:hypothetical protein
MSTHPNYMPTGTEEYIDWEGNLLSTYAPYKGLFGEEVCTDEELEQRVTDHSQLVQIRDAARHADEYKQAMIAIRDAVIGGPKIGLQVAKPDPGIVLSFTATAGGHVKDFGEWVKKIKASPKYNPATHGIIFHIEAGPLPPPDFLNMVSTGYADWDGQGAITTFRTIPRGANGYYVYFEHNGVEELKIASGRGHSNPVQTPPLGPDGKLSLTIITRLEVGGKVVGLPTRQSILLQKDLPARFGVIIEDKVGTQEL